MSFFSRLASGMRRLAFKEALVEADDRFRTWMQKANANRVNPPRRGSAEAIEFYRVSPILRAAAKLIANSVADGVGKFQILVPTRKDGHPVQQSAASEWHQLRYAAPSAERSASLKKLVRRGLAANVNSSRVDAATKSAGEMPMTRILGRNLTGYDGRTLVFQSQIYRLMVGEMAWVVASSGTNPQTGRIVPAGAMSIPPTWIIDTPRPDNPFYRLSRLSWQENVPADRIAWHRDPDLVDPFARGLGAVTTLATELEVDEQAATVMREWMAGGGIGSTIIGLPGSEDVKNLEERWKKNRKNRSAGVPFFMPGTPEVAIRELQNLGAMQAISGVRKDEFDLVRAYFGLPPELFGILANSNRSTIDMAWELFCRVCLIPELETWRSFLQGFLDFYFGEGIYLVDYPSPIPDNREHQLAAATVFPSAFNLGEVRKIGGLAPFGDDRDELIIVPPGVRLTRDLGAEADLEDTEPEPDAENKDDSEV